MATNPQFRSKNQPTAICRVFAGPFHRLLNRLFPARSGAGRIAAVNDAAAVTGPAVVASVGFEVCNEAAPDGAMKPWRIAPLGEYPVRMADGRRLIQVVDAEAVRKMEAAVNTWLGKLRSAVGFGGLPIYEGHPDNPEWQSRHPGIKAAAVGRIQSVEARADGLWGIPALNDQGKGLLTGPAPAYAHQSPHWILEPIPGRLNHFRPMELRSIGLTNQPNLPAELTTVAANEGGSKPEDNTMPPWLIALLAPLGVKAESTQAEIEAALTKLMASAKGNTDKEAAAAAAAAAAQTAATAAANEITSLKAEVQTLRKSRAEAAVNSLLASGRIKESERAATVTELSACNEADYATKVTALNAKTAAVNTAVFPHLAARRQEAGQSTDKISAINEAVSTYMKDKGITDRDQAWAAVKKAQPTLFA